MDKWAFSIFNEVAPVRARNYVRKLSVPIGYEKAGSGHDGILLLTDRQTYLKTFERVETYRTERDVYQRLSEHEVVEVLGHSVPQLLNFDDALGVIEMTTVTPPYLLDFGKARLDQPLDEAWPAHVLAERWAYWESLFPPDRGGQVRTIFALLGKRYGIWLEDLHPGNIKF